MSALTKRQQEVIADNLRAYIANFGYIRIENNYGFYVYTSENSDSWTQYCYNIDYLNGWLYGAVQAANGIMKRIEKECFK